MEALEFVFQLNWKNGSGGPKSVVMLHDTPAVTDSLELFKSNLFRNAGRGDLDEAGLRVAMEVNPTNEWSIDSQLEFERALFAFRFKAIKEEVIVINVYESSDDNVQSQTANEAESRALDGRATFDCKEPPQWPLTFMQQRDTAVDEMSPQRGTLHNILELPPEMLLAVFQKLDHKSVAKCARVCKIFNEVSKAPELFGDLKIKWEDSAKYAEWLLSRATNPRKVFVSNRRRISGLISNKLGMWHNCKQLQLHSLDLLNLSDVSLKNLRDLSLGYCRINCKTITRLLGHCKAIRKVHIFRNYCLDCCERAVTEVYCDRGILSSLDSETCVEKLEEVMFENQVVTVEDLQILSVCASLKTLHLSEAPRRDSRQVTLALDMITKNCTKLERVCFGDSDYITDDVLTILFRNCSNLKELTLRSLSNVTEESCLMAIHIWPQLRKISILRCPLLTQSSEVKLRDAIARLERLSNTAWSPELEFYL